MVEPIRKFEFEIGKEELIVEVLSNSDGFFMKTKHKGYYFTATIKDIIIENMSLDEFEEFHDTYPPNLSVSDNVITITYSPPKIKHEIIFPLVKEELTEVEDLKRQLEFVRSELDKIKKLPDFEKIEFIYSVEKCGIIIKGSKKAKKWLNRLLYLILPGGCINDKYFIGNWRETYSSAEEYIARDRKNFYSLKTPEHKIDIIRELFNIFRCQGIVPFSTAYICALLPEWNKESYIYDSFEEDTPLLKVTLTNLPEFTEKKEGISLKDLRNMSIQSLQMCPVYVGTLILTDAEPRPACLTFYYKY